MTARTPGFARRTSTVSLLAFALVASVGCSTDESRGAQGGAQSARGSVSDASLEGRNASTAPAEAPRQGMRHSSHDDGESTVRRPQERKDLGLVAACDESKYEGDQGAQGDVACEASSESHEGRK
jgi:hypothetical protein